MSISILLLEHFFTKQIKKSTIIQMTKKIITSNMSLSVCGASVVVKAVVVVGGKVVVLVFSVHPMNMLQ